MPRPSNTEERQAQIVTGLMHEMASRGYDQASIGAIAKAAGLTQGVVHYHFKNKQQILLRLVELLAATIRARYETRVSDSSSPEQKLWAYIDAHVALGADADPNAVACWIYISAEAVRQPEVGELFRRLVAEDLSELQTLLNGVLTSQKLSTKDSKQMAAAVFAAIQGMLQLSSAAPDAIPVGSAAGSIRSMTAGLLQARGWTK
ncbi:MAG: TetR family transcriptional regulator [Myxococcales bacterium]|nr:TetR family transcriptional regulator [Myxococcales bacterium]